MVGFSQSALLKCTLGIFVACVWVNPTQSLLRCEIERESRVKVDESILYKLVDEIKVK